MKRKLFGLIGAIGIALGVGSCKSTTQSTTFKFETDRVYTHLHISNYLVNGKYGKIINYRIYENDMIEIEFELYENGINYTQAPVSKGKITMICKIQEVRMYTDGYCFECGGSHQIVDGLRP